MTMLKIRLGAVIDPSLALGFKTYEQAALRAEKVVRAESARSAKMQERLALQIARDQTRAQKHVEGVRTAYFREQQRNEERVARQATAVQTRAARQMALAQAKAARDREGLARKEETELARAETRKARAHEKSLDYVAKLRTRHFATQQRLEEQAARQSEARQRQADRQSESRRVRFGRDMGNAFIRDSGRLISGIGRAGMGLARGAASGYGIDTSIGGNIGSSIETHATARRITQSGMAATGQAVTAAEIQKTYDAIAAAADKAGVKIGDLAGGLEDFVSASGDLSGGKQMLDSLTEIAQANGASVKDIMGLGGFAYRTVKGSGNEAEDVQRIVSGFAYQGAIGNVELKDTGQYASRYMASAKKAGGNIVENTLQLGALGQLAMEGGRVDAAEATGSAASFFADIQKNRTQKHWDEMFGQKNFTWADPGKNTESKQAFDLIKAAIDKTQGDMTQLQKLFPNQKSFAIVQGAAEKFKEAGGGSAGMAKLDEALQRYMTPQSKEWISGSAAVARGSDEAAGNRMSNEFEKASSALTQELTPAIRQLTPHIKDAAKFVSQWVSNIKNNPTTAIGTALSALILKSGAEAVIKDGFTNLFAGAKGGGAGAGAPLAVAVVLWSAGKLLVDFGFDQADQADKSQRKDLIDSGNAISYATGLVQRMRAGEKVTDAEKQKAMKGLAEARSDLTQRVQSTGPQSTWDKIKDQSGWLWNAGGMVARNFRREGQDQSQNDENFVKNSAEIARLNANLSSLTDQLATPITVNVNLENQPDRDPDVK